jgi:hypothetical protein
MITFESGFVRLAIEKNQGAELVAESVAHLLRVCRLNNFRRALVVTELDDKSWQSGLTEEVRFTVRGSKAATRLGVVVPQLSTVLASDVRRSAEAAGFECRLFSDEAEAVRWLEA